MQNRVSWRVPSYSYWHVQWSNRDAVPTLVS